MANDQNTAIGSITEKIWFGFFSTVIIFFVIAFIIHAQADDMVLELKDVQFFQAQQSSDSPITIKLSGLAFHSSLAVREITTQQHDETLQVFVHLTPATAGASGNFDYTLTIPAAVNAVSFGNRGIVIWSRDRGILQPK